jgi:crotonobetainyl-CoA:carnitine CoA-transferase CaiB-like acyl-CoA transferase
MTATGPLAGVKVLDLTTVLMGPFATQLLAGLGAEVIKVEPPDGDGIRRIGPMRNPGMGHIFLHVNRGKKSVALDLKQAPARDALLRLAERADVFVSNVRPAAMQRLGLGYDAVAARNPRIVYVTCCGFGQRGPSAAKPAYDDLIQGAAGVPWLMQQAGAPAPAYAPMAIADRLTGLHAAYAVAAALFARERTGKGQAVEVPMFEAATQVFMSDHLGGLTFDPPLGEPGYARLLTPQRRPYETRDGHLCVLIYNDKQWKNFFAAIGEPERLERDARFSSQTARGEHIDAVYAYVAGVMRTRTTAEWQRLLDEADIPHQPMNSPADVLADPHLRAVGFVGEEDHPSEGRLRTLGTPTAWSGTPPAKPAPAPRLGEHTIEVLREAGFAAAEIERLLASGAALNERKR